MKLRLIYLSLLFFSPHFIDGRQAAQEKIDYAKKHLTIKEKKINVLYFLPDDEVNIKKILEGLIYNEKKSIHFAQFILNDKDIALAICDAKDRGVKISGVVDAGSLAYRNEKVTMLQQKNIDIAFYKKLYSIMHLKCFLFGDNFFNKPIFYFGSANTTFSGYKKNQEFVQVTNKNEFIDQFNQKFKKLYKESKVMAINSLQKRFIFNALKHSIQ